jgi:hypothetical protein
MNDKRIGELSFGGFFLSTATLLILALIVFVPLSKRMKTVDEPSESRKAIKELGERVREIDVLKGQIETMENRKTPTPENKTQGVNQEQGAAEKQNPPNSKNKH